jgi:hypothetical protein
MVPPDAVDPIVLPGAGSVGEVAGAGAGVGADVWGADGAAGEAGFGAGWVAQPARAASSHDATSRRQTARTAKLRIDVGSPQTLRSMTPGVDVA